MKTLADIRRQLAAGDFEFSRHAFRRAIERNISDREIREAGEQAEVIEDYPDDKYSPSALLLVRVHHRWTGLALAGIIRRSRIGEDHHTL